ncbi:hypothetical protein [Clavibacter michiganensis]|uniref:hypothetical protein n=1 Tax=Clavibacter michiganensis TaxID=28447 RepID=UPI0011B01719|nr:hypothetical protein [Clavibacter michiganensis]
MRRAQRVRYLADETDRLVEAGAARQQSVDTKASFLAVAAGIVIAASVSKNWRVADSIALAPLVFSMLALASAAVALRPGRRRDLTPKGITQRWLDSESTFETVESALLAQKVEAFEIREHEIANRAHVVVLGFVTLLLSTVALVAVFAVDISNR